MRTVEKCKGHPLAIKVIESVLRVRAMTTTAWDDFFSSSMWSDYVMSALLLSSASDVISALELNNPPDVKSAIWLNVPDEVIAALWLSYMDLPLYLKSCFLYCSLFHADNEISRTDLTRMWIAEGFIEEDGKQSMEDLAEAYHEELVARNLFQVVDTRKIGSFFVVNVWCKVHDLVRQMAISVSLWQKDTMKPRRLSTTSVDDIEALNESTPLRSLLVFDKIMTEMPQGIFDKLRYLRVLNLQRTSIKHLTDSIGNLIQLRYLNLSNAPIGKLPDSLCNLRYLQTLLLRDCTSLEKLPKDLRHLQKLRHLMVDNMMMPAGIGELEHLQTLDVFRLHNDNQNNGGEGSQDDNEKEVGSNIHELESLSQLRCLKIKGLENVRSGAEAKKAAMHDKTQLRILVLSWNDVSGGVDEGEKKRMEEVLKELCPCPSLQVLQVWGFGGWELPSWIMRSTSYHSFESLEYLNLVHVNFIQRLPSLRQFPQLKEFHIEDNDGIVDIGWDLVWRRGKHFLQARSHVFHRYERVGRMERWNGGREEEQNYKNK
ncbi:Disease resistance protein RPM1 [Acorus calamus]|uniref:Disease resistance protein RPM1 n=1 Tax=Acorus calamus TaxID=4465 RepID=A0AAV9CWF2_ACOCL|nr:Disease resistance protein RPM1 [Acorus calamus]